jgi:subtilisin family serine protease
MAPNAKILPLKAFNADGSGYASDILRAIYYSVNQGAKVMNMSFSFTTSSSELQRAIDYATSKGLVAVASTGNDGRRISVYPAALPNVMGVASTTNYDTISDFSNYGPDAAWLAAPGEAIVTTYPFGTWAAVWGTSFSTPFASGAAALLAQVSSKISNTQAADAEGNAKWISAEVRRGRLDIPAAVRAWRSALGLK